MDTTDNGRLAEECTRAVAEAAAILDLEPLVLAERLRGGAIADLVLELRIAKGLIGYRQDRQRIEALLARITARS